MTASADTEVTAEIMKIEQDRCRALSEQDWPALEAILHPDYSHTHTTGKVEDKSEYMESMKARPRETFRRDLNLRLYGDSAVMMGIQTNKSLGANGPAVMDSIVIQVWIDQGGWKLVATQNTRLPD